MCKWNFPNNCCGQIAGVANAGIETFSGTEILSLAREICQNSLDAAKNTGECVNVEFEKYVIESKDIPGYVNYKESIRKASAYWEEQDSNKAAQFLQRATKEIKKKYSFVLRISDYNTTGLSNPYGYESDGWNSLTKIDGGATKNGDKNGAFGIGKNAPFCNSDLRLVFYRTLNMENEIAAQGMSRFLSFPEDEKDIIHSMTTGIGYYGNSDGNMPVDKIDELDKLNVRKEVGTDVFVYGFNGGDNWKESIIGEILDNFIMSIDMGLLTVKVDDELINKDTLDTLVKRYEKKKKNAYSTYQVLTSSDTKEFKLNFHDMGDIVLKVLVDNETKLNKKVLVTRTSGMRLFYWGNISKLISFSAVLEMRGSELNEYFREMETPSHDNWKPGRHTKNPEQAKLFYDEFKRWISDSILSLGEYAGEDELEVEGLSSILNQSGDKEKSDDESKETLKDNVGQIVIQPRVSQKKHVGLLHGNEGDEDKKTERVKGTIDPDGNAPATRTLGGNRHRTNTDIHTGTEDLDGRDTVEKNINKIGVVKLDDLRIIKLSHQRFLLSFTSPKTINVGHIEIGAIGENGRAAKLFLKEVKSRTENVQVNMKTNKIECYGIKEDCKTKIEFSLVGSRDYAMEVNLYEHN